MKKLLVTLTMVTVAVGAFGQGKLSFQNNINQLVYFTTDATHLLAADAGKSVGGFPLAGSSMSAGANSTITSLAGAPTFTVALYAGATAGSLASVAVTTVGDPNSGGLLTPLNVTLAALSAGTAAFFDIQIFDSRATSFANARTTVNPANPTGSLSMYSGHSGVFSAVPSAAAYSPIWNPSSPVNSTMAVGSSYVPKDYAGFAGYFGSIVIDAAIIPEPGTFALAGLGLATLLAFRRRS